MKEKALIASISKRNENANWIVGIFHNNKFDTLSIGEKNSIIMGPRFNAFLEAIKQKAKRYPIDVTFNHLQEGREIDIKFLGEEPIYIDGSFSLNRLLQNARFHFAKEVRGNPLSVSNRVFKQSEAAKRDIEQNIASDNEDYIMIASIKSVIDGDTIHVRPQYLGSKLKKYFKTGELCKIRYNGIDTPEKKVDGELNAYKEKENQETARVYGVSVEAIYKVGQEATMKNFALLGGGDQSGYLVLLVMDRDRKGVPASDAGYGRYIADVYATRDRLVDAVLDKIKEGHSFIHVNKTMLVTKSKAYPHIPLATYSSKYTITGETALNPLGWKTELGIDDYNPDSVGNIGDLVGNLEPDRIEVPETSLDPLLEFSGMIDPTSNAHDFFNHYDDRFDEFIAGIENEEDLKKHTRTRIGDVILQIPPTSIRVNKEASISRLKTLRTKSSVLINSGQTMTTLTMDLYFHNLEAINGRAIPWKKGSDKSFFVDGLRPLLSQFAKCPFVPIDNYYINKIIGVNDVALLDIAVNTVPNFPESMVATITLVDFNCEAYFMDKSCLYESINYPLMRWYYNLSMIDRGEPYRVFKGLSGPLSNNVSFTLAESEYLEARKQAINYLKKADSPEKRRANFEKNSVAEYLKKDKEIVDSVLKQKRIYDKLPIPTHGVLAFKNHLKSKSGLRKALQKKYAINKEVAENAIEEGNEWFFKVYDGAIADRINNVYTGPSGGALYNDNLITPVENSFNTFIRGKNLFIPYKSQFYFPDRFNDLGGTMIVDYSKAPYKGTESSGLFLINKFKDLQNIALLEEKFKKCFNSETNTYAIPATEENIEILKNISERRKNIEAELDEYEEEYQKHVALVEETEMGIPMSPYTINGRFITTNVSASFSNEFSMIKVQSSDGPTFQYLGGGDPSITMVFEMDETAAKDFRSLLDISDRYCKIYNQGITNGFIGIQNDLANLFGIRYIMIENCQINTVEGFPGRLQVAVTAVGFDKTQSQREALRNIYGFAEDTDLDKLGVKSEYVNDRMLEARLNFVEVYPDLELPTYDELNAALKHIDIGNGVETYKNRTNGVYVDPDFYFSTNKTLRDSISEEYDKAHQFNMYDSIGVALATSSNDQEGLYRTTDENWEKLKEIDEDEEVEPLNWIFEWENSDKQPTTLPALLGGGMIKDESTVKNAEVKAFLDAKDDDGNFKFYTFPTFEEWKTLFPNHTEKQYENRKKQPSEGEIYKYLDEKVDKYFKKYYHSPELVQSLKGANAETKAQSVLGPCYCSPDDYYAAYYHWQYNQLNATQQAKVNEHIKNKDIKPPKINKSEMKYTHVNTKGLHPKERIMTQLRAFLTASSSWRHIDNGKVVINPNKTKVGLCYVDISSPDIELAEVKRIMYNWRHNLKVAVERLAQCYARARELRDDCKNFGPYCRPLDMMIYHYDKQDGEATTVKYMKKSKLCAGTIAAFYDYRNRPYDTHSGYNNEVLAYHLGDEGYIIDKTMGKKDEYIAKLLEYEFYDLKILEANDLTVSSNYSEIKPVMKKYLEGLTKDQVFSIHTNHITKLNDLGNFGGGSYPRSKKDENGYYYSAKLLVSARQDYLQIKNANESFGNSQNESMRQLVCSDDPQALYRTMFYEMRRYDQRGRMIRAFPTFSMFIIHEGDTYGKYKFWDNMYGFNAIESIDIHRSRKIAADTAIINMSNAYSNLTTRRTDVDYIDRQLKFWDNMIFKNPPEELVEKRKNETFKSIYLETGARIHLRMGYGSNAQELPVVFNGTITEIEMGDVVQIIGQGDGIELGNIISGDPKDDNKGLFFVTEPRDLICKFLASKGNWMKDFLNRITSNQLFGDNPLGIAHFGHSFDPYTHSQPLGTLEWRNDEYGEVAQNIYSSNGTPTFSQWLTPAGKPDKITRDFSWEKLWENKFNLTNPGDEPNVVMNFYNQTVWDIIQTITYTSPDYICAVHPFETRSTLFFGKPYWPAVFSYDSRYEYDIKTKTWSRYLMREPRRSYMQQRFYTSFQDIIENNICASEDGLFTNVVVNYDGHQTPTLYADVDIRFDKLKTRSVDANIIATSPDHFTSEVMATYYGCSVLRDNMKDMYKGSFLVVGDPSVKPHDMFHIQDERNDMNGSALVKSVTHHFSAETGFVTKIEPDLLAVNDDVVMLNLRNWGYSFATRLAIQVAAHYGMKKLFARYGGKWLFNSDKLNKELAKAIGNKAIEALDKLASKNPTMKKAHTKATKAAVSAIASGKNIYNKILNVVKVISFGNPYSAIIHAAVWIGSELLFENMRRFKQTLQTVTIVPLTYQGKELTAGVNSHAGLVYGEAPGKIKSYFDATFGKDAGAAEDIFGVNFNRLMNFFNGSGGMYSDPKVEEQLGAVYKK